MALLINKTIRNMLWIFLLGTLSNAAIYITRIVFARNLTVEEYGLFFSVLSIVFIFSTLRDFGLCEAMIFHVNKHISKQKDDEIKKILIICIGVQTLIALVIALIFFAIKNFLAINYFHNTLSIPIIELLLLVFVSEVFLIFFSTSFVIYEKFSLSKFGELIKSFTILTAAILFFRYAVLKNYLVPAGAYVVGTVVSAITMGILFVRKFKPILSEKITFSRQDLKSVFSYSLPIFFSNGMAIIINYSDTIMLTLLSNFETVGLYSVSYLALVIILSFVLPLQTVLFPKIAHLYHGNAKNAITDLIDIIYSNILLIFLPLATIFFAYSDFAVTFFFGQPYAGASVVFKVFSVFGIFAALSNLNFSILAGIEKTKERSLYLLYAAVLNIILNGALIPAFKGVGAAFATGISFLFLFILTIRKIHAAYPFRVYILTQLKILLASAVFLVSIKWLNQLITLNPFIQIPLVLISAGIVYCAMLLLLNVINREKLVKFKKLFLNSSLKT